jgi:hypothetical protein
MHRLGDIDRCSKLFLHPLFATCVTLLIIVTGLLGSIWTGEIKSAFPFSLPGKHVQWEAVIFWTLVIVCSLAFLFRQRADDRARAEQQRKLMEATARLENLIRTMPPDDFLPIFSDLYMASDRVASVVLGSKSANKPEIEVSIRHVLRIIATLAQEFDADASGTYCANVMLFRAADSLNGTEAEAVAQRLLFCDEAVSVSQLKGVLDLATELSACAANEKAEPDANLKPFALPIPKTARLHNKYRVLPGAPVAFVDRELDLYSDTSQLANWCETQGDFTKDVIKRLDRFFDENPQVRSFISIPLFVPENRDGDPFAVLNIHADKPNLLTVEGNPDSPLLHFAPIVTPIQIILVKLLLARQAVKEIPATE